MRNNRLPIGLILKWKHIGDNTSGASALVDEQRRRDIWDFKHDFGAEASDREKELEMAHRRLFKPVPRLSGHNDATEQLDERSESPPRRADSP